LLPAGSNLSFTIRLIAMDKAPADFSNEVGELWFLGINIPTRMDTGACWAKHWVMEIMVMMI